MTTQNPSGWPGGWYVYENGKVEGPLTAEQAFGMAAEGGDGKPRLVSRKGFSQWYALKDLSEIFRMTEQLGRKVAEHGKMSEAQLVAHAAALGATATPASNAKPKTKPKVQGKNLEPAGDRRAPEAAPVTVAVAPAPTPAASAASPAATPAPALARPPLSTAIVAPTRMAAVPVPRLDHMGDVPVPRLSPPAVEEPGLIARALAKARATTRQRPAREPDEAGAAVPPAQPFSRSPASAVPPAKAVAASPIKNPKTRLMQEYFLARGRLRLGKLRNPWLTGLVGLPLSLGTFWYVWVRDLAREVAFHARSGDQAKMPSAALALVPFYHIYLIHRLAAQVAEMERQNKYQSVNPAVAALLAVFPPFTVVYLQGAANRHWLLHVKHSAIKKTPEEAPAA